MRKTIELDYTCEKCGAVLRATRSMSVDRDELWADLKQIGQKVLYPHFKTHYPSGVCGYIKFTPFFASGVEIDWDIIKRQEKEAYTSIIYPLMTSVTNGKLWFLF